MKIIMKIFIAILTIQTILIYADPDVKTKPTALPIKSTLFVNGRFNKIELIFTDHKNKQFSKHIQPGNDYEYHHEPLHIKKVVCREKLAANTTLSSTDLQTYAAFAFNVDKVEKYHFINVRQQEAALKWVRNNDYKNETLLNEILTPHKK